MSSITIAIHELWKTNRALALELLSQFHGQLTGYSDDELVSLASLEKRFDRQNNTNGGGNPTSVWTSLVVTVQQNEVMEGRLTELYPHGVACPTYDLSCDTSAQISRALATANLTEVSNPNNKTNAQGEDTSYEGTSWREVIGSFLGLAMELTLGSATPAGFVRVPMEHKQPPMEEGGDYTALDLFWCSAKHGTEINNDSLAEIGAHILGFNIILVSEFIDDGDEARAFVLADSNFQYEIAQLEALQA